MAKFDVVDMSGKKVSTVELSDAVFGITPNEKAVHEAVVNFLANQRQGTQNTKIRKEVRGGGKKPWRQKGTGHASGFRSVSSPFAYGAFTLSGRLSQTFLLESLNLKCGPNPGVHALRFGLFRFRSPLLTKSMFLSLPPAT